MWLFVLFVAVPVIEIGLFIQVGGIIGLWPTLAIVIATAIVGTSMMRAQGAMAMNNLRNSMGQMQDPTEDLAHGAMILFSGALLLTPGFFTDAVGFLLLIPAFRTLTFNFLRQRINVQSFSMGGQGPVHRDDGTIETEYVDITNQKSDDDGPSGWTKR